MGTELQEIVLIVEDEQVIREAAVSYLRKNELLVESCTSGNQALNVIAERIKVSGNPKIKAIVTDWMMEDGNGIELLEKIRGSSFSSIPILLVSGIVTREQLEGAISLDADAVLLKPFSLAQMMKKIKDAIANREKKEDLKLMQAINSIK